MLLPSGVQSLVVVTTGIVAVSADSIDNMVDCNIGSQPAQMHMQDCVKATLLGKCSMPASTWKKKEMDGGLELACCVECDEVCVASSIDVLSSNKAKYTYSPFIIFAAAELALAQGATAVVVAEFTGTVIVAVFAGTVIVLIRCLLGQLQVN